MPVEERSIAHLKLENKEERVSRFWLAAAVCIVGVMQCPADFSWVTSMQGDSSTGVGVAADHHGNSYIIGNFSGTVSFGSNMLTSAGGSDVFVAKIGRKGDVRWVISAGGTNDDSAYKIFASPEGTIFVTGLFGSNAAFATPRFFTNELNGEFVAKITTQGAVVWLRLLSNMAARTAFLARSQAVWFVGSEDGFKAFSGFDSHGERTQKIVTESPNFRTVDLAIDRTGAFYVSWDGYRSSLTCNLATKFNPFGQIEWEQEVPVSRYLQSYGVAIASGGRHDIAVLGNGRNVFLIPGGGGYPSPGMFLSRLSSTGGVQTTTWAGEYKGAYEARDIAVNRRGEAFVAAHFWTSYVSAYPHPGALIFGPYWSYTITNAYVNRYRIFAPIEARAIAADPFGYTYVTGDYGGACVFGTTIVGSTEDRVSRAFVTRLNDSVHRAH